MHYRPKFDVNIKSDIDNKERREIRYDTTWNAERTLESWRVGYLAWLHAQQSLLIPCLHDTTGCQCGCQTGLTTGCIVYTNI